MLLLFRGGVKWEPSSSRLRQHGVRDARDTGVVDLALRRLLAALVLVVMIFGTVPEAGAAVRVRLVGENPLVVLGSGFRPAERVRAEALRRDAGPLLRVVRANRNGVVIVRWPGLSAGYCSGAYAVRLTGARSGMARLRLSPMRDCAPLAP